MIDIVSYALKMGGMHVNVVYFWSKTSRLPCMQGFRQDKIIASHTCFGGHMDVNC